MRKSNLSNYTHPLLGTVPKNWKWYRINEICTISSGGTPSRKERDNFKGNILWVTSGELKNRTIEDTLEKISDGAVEEFNLTLYDPETVIIAIYGLEAEGVRGTASILKKKSTISQACMAFTNFQGLSNVYFYYWYLNYGSIIGKRYAQGTKQQNLSQDVVATIPICCPPLPEQQKIAAILSTQDKVIELKEKLLVQKQQQKKYLMQQLLTGRKPHKNNPRIEECEIGEVCKINPKQDKISESQVVFLGMADISETGSVVSQRLVDFSHIQSGFTAFRRGDILIAKITPCFENGKGAYTDNLLSEHGFGSTEFHVLRTNSKVNAKYIFYHTVSEKFRKKLEREMTGSAGQKRVPAISIQKYKIFLPSSNEQNFIIEILSTADHEIDLLQKSIDAEKQKKKALMQLLLTGKVRVKI